jgi:hypothetical protein
MGEGGRRPDEGTFVATVSNIYIFMREPSPALSGTLSHPVSLCFSGRERANAAAISLDQLRMHQIALCSARDGVKGIAGSKHQIESFGMPVNA